MTGWNGELISSSHRPNRTMAPGVRPCRDLGGQPGLADAGFAEHPHGVGLLDGAGESDRVIQLVMPADETDRATGRELERQREPGRDRTPLPLDGAGCDRLGQTLQLEEANDCES